VTCDAVSCETVTKNGHHACPFPFTLNGNYSYKNFIVTGNKPVYMSETAFTSRPACPHFHTPSWPGCGHEALFNMSSWLTSPFPFPRSSCFGFESMNISDTFKYMNIVKLKNPCFYFCGIIYIYILDSPCYRSTAHLQTLVCSTLICASLISSK